MGDDREGVPAGRPSSSYVPALDGLRAVAVALVVVHHAASVPFGGQIGVDIFFVLSGYLITGLLLKEVDRTGGIRLRDFYVRRAIRLYPPLVTALVALLVPGLLLAPSLRRLLGENVMALTYTTPFGLLVSEDGSRPWRHTWSLGMEELFYLVWPLLLLLLLRLKIRIDATAAVMGATVLGTGMVVAVAMPSLGGGAHYFFRAGGLLLGCALAVWLRRRRDAVIPGYVGWIGAAAVAFAVMLPQELAPLVAALGSVLWVAQLTRGRENVVTRTLRRRPIAYIGTISYEIYLWHYPLLVMASWAFGGLSPMMAWAMVLLSVFLAAVTHRAWAPVIDAMKSRFARAGRNDEPSGDTAQPVGS